MTRGVARSLTLNQVISNKHERRAPADFLLWETDPIWPQVRIPSNGRSVACQLLLKDDRSSIRIAMPRWRAPEVGGGG